MTRRLLLLALLLAIPILVHAASPVQYRIHVDTNDLSGVAVEMRFTAAPGSVRIAMAAHPEYDDRYFRYIEDFAAVSGGRTLQVTKPEEAIWLVDGVRGDVTVRYRVRQEPAERSWRQAWKPFLTPTGGMVGDLHMLMYVVGEEKRGARLTLDLPAGWKAVSGLAATAAPHTFAGPVELLLDSPILIGDVKEWKFKAADVPHTVAIWSHPDAKPVDPAPIVDGIQKLAGQAIKAFGKPPYPRYAFLLENGGQAALEHATSVNIGVSRELGDTLATIGHEYVHVWNLMDVRPRERVGLKHKFAEPTGVLWWSEGATIMFADLLIRRAGFAGDRTRVQRLESIIARYLSAPGYSTLSADAVSRGDSHPELLKEEWAGTHLQGEVLTAMLDLMIRDFTNGRKKADDVMRVLASKFDADHGITNKDIERALADVCKCKVSEFFSQYIYGAGMVDFDRYLAFIGMRSEVVWKTAVDNDGKPAVDLRIGPVDPEGELKLRVTNSKSAWARSGLRTGDKLVTADGRAVTTWPEFRQWLRSLKVGDKPRLVIERGGQTRTFDVPLEPFESPTVWVVALENANAKQLRLRAAWMNSN